MQFTIAFQTDHLVAAMEAVPQEIATPQEMLGSFGRQIRNATLKVSIPKKNHGNHWLPQHWHKENTKTDR